jgi:hypothetical protein
MSLSNAEASDAASGGTPFVAEREPGAGYCSSNQPHIPMVCHPFLKRAVLRVAISCCGAPRLTGKSDAGIRAYSKQNPGRWAGAQNRMLH